MQRPNAVHAASVLAFAVTTWSAFLHAADGAAAAEADTESRLHLVPQASR